MACACSLLGLVRPRAAQRARLWGREEVGELRSLTADGTGLVEHFSAHRGEGGPGSPGQFPE